MSQRKTKVPSYKYYFHLGIRVSCRLYSQIKVKIVYGIGFISFKIYTLISKLCYNSCFFPYFFHCRSRDYRYHYNNKSTSFLWEDASCFAFLFPFVSFSHLSWLACMWPWAKVFVDVYSYCSVFAVSDVCFGGCRGKTLLILCPRLLFVSQKRAPESEGPCTGASDAVKVLPFSMLTPLPDALTPSRSPRFPFSQPS